MLESTTARLARAEREVEQEANDKAHWNDWNDWREHDQAFDADMNLRERMVCNG